MGGGGQFKIFEIYNRKFEILQFEIYFCVADEKHKEKGLRKNKSC